MPDQNEERIKDLKKLIISQKAKGVLQVTITIDYLIPGYESMSLDDLAKEWFEKFHLSQYHAYRNGCKIGNSEEVIEYKIITANVPL